MGLIFPQIYMKHVKDFIQSIERGITVSIDRKEGVKVTLEKGNKFNNPGSSSIQPIIKNVNL